MKGGIKIYLPYFIIQFRNCFSIIKSLLVYVEVGTANFFCLESNYQQYYTIKSIKQKHINPSVELSKKKGENR